MSVVPSGSAGTPVLTFRVGFQAAWACRPRGSKVAAGSAVGQITAPDSFLDS
jgi:hypothetical protein